jgi:hypothetical protein
MIVLPAQTWSSDRARSSKPWFLPTKPAAAAASAEQTASSSHCADNTSTFARVVVLILGDGVNSVAVRKDHVEQADVRILLDGGINRLLRLSCRGDDVMSDAAK